MGVVRIAQDLIDWAAAGNWSVSFSAEGDVTFWDDPGGEIKFFVREDPDGWIEVSTSHRGGARERFIDVASSDLLAVFVTGYFGGSVREARKLPLLDIPFEMSGVFPGFAIVHSNPEAGATLVSSEGVSLAKSDLGEMNVGNLVELSHYLSGSLDALRESLLSPEGGPLFSVL